jgi:hypothetical protein
MMRKFFLAVAASLMITFASAPARAGYWETSVYAGSAVNSAAIGWFNATLQLHYEANYNYIDWSLIYNAWTNVSEAADYAYSAYWNAPVGSQAESYSYLAYIYLDATADNLWNVYAYGGQYPEYATSAIVYALYGQIYLGNATIAAAGHY